ncbi:uncharacterized protein LOC120682396 isoform X1 [Panicum virgatum]|uniref:DUF1618 domain-containing protein n=1 Tax=Panicum virgatum TaxID=38727 RepID=A0A8T0Q0Q5_PANVG|nr:uncharacterized protein LOC120682396 isoform X1 [Panicum virgatum]KAG2567470.1 hypothetical protein PVAP13_7NG357900 [Panicum virgatum]
MAPPWVLLDRQVKFVDGGLFAGAAIGGSSREPTLEEALLVMEPHPVVADPPEVTFLSMLRMIPAHPMQKVHDATISSTDKNLVVLYTGMYRPGNGGYARDGCYLVYDASRNSLAVIPQLDPAAGGRLVPVLRTIKCLGNSAAIVRHGGETGAFVLAELVTTYHPGLPDAQLYQWWSSCAGVNSGRWLRSAVRLPLPPDLCGPTYFFQIDMAFVFQGSICWVDLLTGILICDLFALQEPEFSFIPLPQGRSLHTPNNVRLGLKVQAFRSMGIVRGAIKFVALIGYTETSLSKSSNLVLETWTCHDLREWKKGPALRVGDLWASESFSKMELPRVRPMFPVLCMDEDEIVIFLNDVEYVDKVDRFGQITGRQLVLNGHYVVRLDLVQNKVLYSKGGTTNNLALLEPALLASDFSAYLRGSKHRQSGKEASNVGAIMKRPRY